MSLRETTVADIVDSTRPVNASVVHVAGKTKQFATLELVQNKLRNVGVESTFSSLDSFSTLSIDVNIDVDDLLPENDPNYYYHDLKLRFVDNILQVRCGYRDIWQSINDVSHVVRIVDAIKARLQVQWKRKQKRMKVHDLHTRGVELQVMTLAKRLDLSCRFERLHTQIWISIFDSPIDAGVEAYIPLDESPHDHFAKFEKKVLGFHQRQQKRAHRHAARERKK